jgi:pimeloyl-ACP methyl ester carboxylesterase
MIASMTRPTIVLLPGLLCDDAVWAVQREALSAWDCVVPSYALSDSIESMARGVLDAVPAERFSLAGHSMGARVALEALRQAPRRIERLALFDTGLDPLAAGPEGDRERVQREALLGLARAQGMRAMGLQWAPNMVLPAHRDAPVFGEILAMIERKSPMVFARQISALLGRPDARAVFASSTCPTLIGCGRQDAWSPLARHQQMQRLLPASRLVVIEDSGHMSPMEQPTAVTRALLEWLADASG